MPILRKVMFVKKCPYAVNRIVQTKTEINYDAESKEDSSVVTTINKAEFTDCLEGGCGAYNLGTGKCEYGRQNY